MGERRMHRRRPTRSRRLISSRPGSISRGALVKSERKALSVTSNQSILFNNILHLFTPSRSSVITRPRTHTHSTAMHTTRTGHRPAAAPCAHQRPGGAHSAAAGHTNAGKETRSAAPIRASPDADPMNRKEEARAQSVGSIRRRGRSQFTSSPCRRPPCGRAAGPCGARR